MQLTKKTLLGAGIAAPLMLLAQPAFAADSSGSMAVNATVLNNCTVVALPIAFGPITDFDAGDIDTTATITLACTPNAAYEVQLNDGVNADAGQRRLANGDGDFIPYEIYQDAARTTRWGDTLLTDTVTGTATLGVATLTAYGRIADGTDSVSAGLYSDTVTVTVQF